MTCRRSRPLSDGADALKLRDGSQTLSDCLLANFPARTKMTPAVKRLMGRPGPSRGAGRMWLGKKRGVSVLRSASLPPTGPGPRGPSGPGAAGKRPEGSIPAPALTTAPLFYAANVSQSRRPSCSDTALSSPPESLCVSSLFAQRRR